MNEVMRVVMVEVTQAHIDKGTRNDCTGCAVALAVAGATVPGTSVVVQQYGVGVDGYPCKPMGDGLRQFVEAFDRGGPVGPCVIPLWVPERAASRFRAPEPVAGAA